MPRLIAFFAILSSFAWVLHAPAANPPTEDWATFYKPGKFITALCATDEAVWIGTEDRGLWRLDLKADPTAKDAWQQFTSQDTATDHVYGIAVDALGRLWVGTVNQGVSVYNGKEWRNYGVLGGCSGERVFAIAADKDPKRGNVWIGTDHGLTCWTPAPSAPLRGDPHNTERGGQAAPRLASSAIERGGSPDPPRGTGEDSSSPFAPGTWRTYTQADGLPSAQVYAVAVAPTGRVWAGTECDGLAWADPPYKKWTCIRASAERSGDAGELPGVGEKGAPGLPSNLSNDLLILKNGTVVVSTDYGLGIGRAGGMVWTSWQGLSKQPYENYTRGLAIDSAGGLWIATRHKGLARLDLKTGEVKRYQCAAVPPKTEKGKSAPKAPPPSLPDNYVFSVAVTAGGDVWAGTYGGGLARLMTPLAAAPKTSAAASPSAVPVAVNPQSAIRNPQLPTPLPEPAGPPTLDQLNTMLADLSKVGPMVRRKEGCAARLGDDWLTRGNWLDRYGRQGAILCAMGGGGNDFNWGYRGSTWSYRAWIGAASRKDDGLRYWVHWMTSEKPQVLQNPILGKRKQSEWDDHGEAYPMSLDGPHTYCAIRIPDGAFRLSLYFFNKDGDSGPNRFRDYLVTLKATPMAQEVFDRIATRDPEAERYFQGNPILARARVRDFRSGVYKGFYVNGPGTYTIKISRNHSFNTICSAVMIDPVGALQPLVPPSASPPNCGTQSLASPIRTLGRLPEAGGRYEAAVLAWGRLRELIKSNPYWFATKSQGEWVTLMREFRREAIEEGRFGDKEANRRLADAFEALNMFADRDQLDDRRRYHWNLWLGKTWYGSQWPEMAEQRRKAQGGELLAQAKARGMDQP